MGDSLPDGLFCMISEMFVDKDGSGIVGTVGEVGLIAKSGGGVELVIRGRVAEISSGTIEFVKLLTRILPIQKYNILLNN